MKHILVVVDMQNDFIDGALGTEEAQNIVTAAADKIRNFQGDIYGTLDTHGEDYLETQEGKNLTVKTAGRSMERFCRLWQRRRQRFMISAKRERLVLENWEMFWQKHAVQRTAELS